MGSSDLPGDDLMQAGLTDLAKGIESVPALLVSIGAPRLRRLGIQAPHPIPSPELRLYALLQQSCRDAAHSRYNALIRRPVTYERAAECVRQPLATASSGSCARSATLRFRTGLPDHVKTCPRVTGRIH